MPTSPTPASPARADVDLDAASDSRPSPAQPLRPLPRGIGDGYAAFCIAMAAALSLVIFRYCNTFTDSYHPDEKTKVHQVTTGEYNFYHPQLMLRGAETLNFIATGDISGDMTSVTKATQRWLRVVRGRSFSALMAAVAVGALGWLAYRQRGLAGAAAAVALVATLPPLVVAAHYFKEDATLVGGTAVALVAGAAYLRRPTWGRLLLAGAAAGLAAGGKTVGVASPVVLALAALALPPRVGHLNDDADSPRPPFARRFLRRIGAGLLALVAAAVVYLSINAPALVASGEDLRFAAKLVTGVAFDNHSDGLVYDSPRLMWRIATRWPIVALLPLAAVELIALVALPSRRRRPELWLLPAMFAVHVAMPCVSRTFHPRYMLVGETLLAVLAGMGAATLGSLVALPFTRRRPRPIVLWIVTALVVAVPLVGQLQRTRGILGDFYRDQRDDLRRWARQSLPEDARVAFDSYSRFGNSTYPFYAEKIDVIRDKRTSASDLRDRGFTHVALSDWSYARYLDPDIRSVPSIAERHAAARERYATLLGGELEFVWSFENPEPWPRATFASPTTYLFRLPGPTPPTPPTSQPATAPAD